jgi:predicted RNase H-like HicB family nuclease
MYYAIVIEKAGNNYSAYVPDLPGCVSTGDTIRQTEKNIRDAIAFHLEGLQQQGDPIPAPSVKCEYVEVVRGAAKSRSSSKTRKSAAGSWVVRRSNGAKARAH